MFFLGIIALSVFYFVNQIRESGTPEDKVQYITCLVLYSFIAILSSIVLFLNRKMNFLKDLKHKETKLQNTFDAKNTKKFPKGELEFYSGSFAVWYGIDINTKKYYLERKIKAGSKKKTQGSKDISISKDKKE